MCAGALCRDSHASLPPPLALETGETGLGAGHGPGPVPGQGKHQLKPMGKGLNQVGINTSVRNDYYRTLIK